MNIREMRMLLGDTQSEFSQRYQIPFRTIQNWEEGIRKPPEYLLKILERQIQNDIINRRTLTLPAYDPNKTDLPKRSDYIGARQWLRAIKDQIGEPVVFALDEALMCQGNFAGRSDECVIWVYGDDSLTKFNGVVVIGNQLHPSNIEEKNGVHYTNFNRTISDAIANEDILDMQGITEALSNYYYRNNESFEGITVSPQCEKSFEQLAKDAISYYDD